MPQRLALLNVLILLSGCAVTPPTPAPVEPLGRAIFQRSCAPCHGGMGEGFGNAPGLIGRQSVFHAGDDRPDRDRFDPRKVLVYFAAEMPADDPGSLSPDEYDEILAYLLEANDLDPRGRRR